MNNNNPKNFICLGDNTAHAAPIITPGVNSKIFYNNILFSTVGGNGIPHPPGHINVITKPNQEKVFFNNIPFGVLGAVCSCGDIVITTPINPKITIT